MAEEYKAPEAPRNLIIIETLTEGFYVTGEKYGGDNRRAFSTAEGLIEWLSRELGAGPIVWYVTLEIWAGEAGVKAEDLVPLPDQTVDPLGYTGALWQNSMFILKRLVDKELERLTPKPPPKPKKKKAKKESKGEPIKEGKE